jgi:hypothetical protein
MLKLIFDFQLDNSKREMNQNIRKTNQTLQSILSSMYLNSPSDCFVFETFQVISIQIFPKLTIFCTKALTKNLKSLPDKIKGFQISYIIGVLLNKVFHIDKKAAH